MACSPSELLRISKVIHPKWPAEGAARRCRGRLDSHP